MRKIKSAIAHESSGKRWAIVLAAGEGTRLGHLTRDPQGRSTPKQFCSASGGPTLLQETLSRGAELAGDERVVSVVASHHAAWWRQDTAGLPERNIVVQPLNRGTAAGILLPLLTIVRRDPDARVVVLPSDHYFADEGLLSAAVRKAFEGIELDRESVVLLGITPERADPELGWIVPAAGHRDAIGRVERFVEKPPIEIAARLQRQGGLWNSFIFVSRAATLIELYRRSLPTLLEELTLAVARDAFDGGRNGAVEQLYPGLATRDFSRDLLESNATALRVLAVGPCGWSDLGTPERLARCVAAFPVPRPAHVRSVPGRWTPTAARPVLAAVV